MTMFFFALHNIKIGEVVIAITQLGLLRKLSTQIATVKGKLSIPICMTNMLLKMISNAYLPDILKTWPGGEGEF